MRRVVCTAALAALLGLGGAAARAQDDEGRKLFNSLTPSCAICHTLKDAGASGAVGPSLDELKPDAARVAKALRNGGDADLLARLADDKRVGLGKKRLTAVLSESDRFVGAAPHQVDAFVDKVEPLVKRMKGAADYRPGKLL